MPHRWPPRLSGSRRPYQPSSAATTVTPAGELGNVVVTSNARAVDLTKNVVWLRVVTPLKTDKMFWVL